MSALRAAVWITTITLFAGRDDATANPFPERRAVSPAALVARQDADGKALYFEHCKVCHGVVGVPTKQSLQKYKKIPNFTDAAFFAGRSDDSLFVVVKKGAGRDMKALADKLSADEMRAVSKYIRIFIRKPS